MGRNITCVRGAVHELDAAVPADRAVFCVLLSRLGHGGHTEIHPVRPVHQPRLSHRALLPHLRRRRGDGDGAGGRSGRHPWRHAGGDLSGGLFHLRRAGILHQLVHGKGLPCPLVGLQPQAHEPERPHLDRQPDAVRSGQRGDRAVDRPVILPDDRKVVPLLAACCRHRHRGAAGNGLCDLPPADGHCPQGDRRPGGRQHRGDQPLRPRAAAGPQPVPAPYPSGVSRAAGPSPRCDGASG